MIDRDVSCDALRGTYAAPMLTVFGAVAELTASGTSGCSEGGPGCLGNENKKKSKKS